MIKELETFVIRTGMEHLAVEKSDRAIKLKATDWVNQKGACLLVRQEPSHASAACFGLINFSVSWLSVPVTTTMER